MGPLFDLGTCGGSQQGGQGQGIGVWMTLPGLGCRLVGRVGKAGRGQAGVCGWAAWAM